MDPAGKARKLIKISAAATPIGLFVVFVLFLAAADFRSIPLAAIALLMILSIAGISTFLPDSDRDRPDPVVNGVGFALLVLFFFRNFVVNLWNQMSFNLDLQVGVQILVGAAILLMGWSTHRRWIAVDALTDDEILEIHRRWKIFGTYS